MSRLNKTGDSQIAMGDSGSTGVFFSISQFKKHNTFKCSYMEKQGIMTVNAMKT